MHFAESERSWWPDCGLLRRREKWKEAAAAYEDAAKSAKSKDVAVAALCSLASVHAAKMCARRPPATFSSIKVVHVPRTNPSVTPCELVHITRFPKRH